jgi:hypothetical protein
MSSVAGSSLANDRGRFHGDDESAGVLPVDNRMTVA